MPKVFNKHHKNAPPEAVYVGRPTPWGNPFSHLPKGTLAQYLVGTRDEAVERYEAWLMDQPALVAQVQRQLAGKDLVCWCSPARCHADVLVRVANLTPTATVSHDPASRSRASQIPAPASSSPSDPVITGRFRRTPRVG
jgi:hypothetical protein